jgi:hypothetical protein
VDRAGRARGCLERKDAPEGTEVKIRKWWIALPAVLVLAGFSISGAGRTSAAPSTSQDVDYVFNGSKLMLLTNTTVAGDMATVTVESLKVDGAIVADAPTCVTEAFGLVFRTTCTFDPLTAQHSISFGVVVQDSPSGLAGKTRVHCQKVDTEGCSGTKSLNMH